MADRGDGDTGVGVIAGVQPPLVGVCLCVFFTPAWMGGGGAVLTGCAAAAAWPWACFELLGRRPCFGGRGRGGSAEARASACTPLSVRCEGAPCCTFTDLTLWSVHDGSGPPAEGGSLWRCPAGDSPPVFPFAPARLWAAVSAPLSPALPSRRVLRLYLL